MNIIQWYWYIKVSTPKQYTSNWTYYSDKCQIELIKDNGMHQTEHIKMMHTQKRTHKSHQTEQITSHDTHEHTTLIKQNSENKKQQQHSDKWTYLLQEHSYTPEPVQIKKTV